MVKVSRGDKSFSPLKTLTLAEAKIQERYDLQEFIWNSPQAFCQELGEDLLIIGKEVEPSSVVGDRIDLLAIDGHGSTVILELKRGNDKYQLFQAISYAGMVAGVATEDVLSYPGIDETRAASIGSFLAGDTETGDFENLAQRIILVAEAFDFEVLAGAQWLHETYEVNIVCVRVSMTSDETSGAEYLAFTQVFPTPEIKEIAKQRGRRGLLGLAASRTSSAEEPRFTVGELLKMADDQQNRSLVDICRQLSAIWDEAPEGGTFYYSKKTPIGWRSLFKLFASPEKMKTPKGQLDVSIVTRNLAELTGQDHDVIRNALAEHYPQLTPYVKYCVIRLSTSAEAETLVALLQKWWDLRPQEQMK